MKRLDAPRTDTIAVHVPIEFARRGGRKAIITPDGRPAQTGKHSDANSPLIAALARAFRWRKQLETGTYATVAEIAAAERINDSYASRILRLTLLAPDIVEAILNKGATGPEMWQMLRPFPIEWPNQRRLFSELG